MEITHGRGSEFIGHELINSLLREEYRITDKPITLGNTMYNAILEWIHQFLGNLVHNYNITQTHVDEDDPCLGILAATEFVIHSTTNR